jgi:hypothetical protein
MLILARARSEVPDFALEARDSVPDLLPARDGLHQSGLQMKGQVLKINNYVSSFFCLEW